MPEQMNADAYHQQGHNAFAEKKLKEALANWKKALELDPNHQGARQGIEKLKQIKAKTKSKKTAKEVLAQIKALYGEKHFAEALKLSETLVQRYPKNEDLQNLHTKIKSRLAKAQAAQSMDAPEAMPGEATTVMMNSLQVDEDSGGDIDSLIKNGIQLFEAGDLASAEGAFSKAKEIDGNNRIVVDYLKAIHEKKIRLEAEKHVNEPTVPVSSMPKSGESGDAPAPDLPSKEELEKVYNEGLACYKSRDYLGAMEKWNFILGFFPNHKETQQCLEKTREAIAKEEELKQTIAKARKELSAGNQTQAELLLSQIQAENDDEDVRLLREAIEERKRQINEIRSLELEDEGDHTQVASASEEEITKYFTPVEQVTATESVVTQVKVAKKKKKKKFNPVPLIILIIALGGLGAGGYYGWQTYERRLITGDEASTPTFIYQIEWKSPIGRAENYILLGEEFYAESEYLLAHYAAERAKEVCDESLQMLAAMPQSTRTPEHDFQENRLGDMATQAQTALNRVKDKIVVDDDPAKRTELINQGSALLAEERYTDAAKKLEEALTFKYDDFEVRLKAAIAEERIAFSALHRGELTEALLRFKRAATLRSNDENLRRHIYVIDKFFGNSISATDKDQWFFLFL